MPWSAGFLNWPAYHYIRFRLARTIRAILNAYNNAENPVIWTNEHPDQFKIVVMIQKARRGR